MLTLDVLTLPHVAALLWAIDDGDDSALPILADALEEAGDARGQGLRGVSVDPFFGGPNRRDGAEGWFFARGAGLLAGHCEPTFDRLAGELVEMDTLAKDGSAHERHPCRRYPTRSAAFLALAQALTETA